MHTPGPIDVQHGPDIGCRVTGCYTQSDIAYVLCAEHQRLARAAPDLLRGCQAAIAYLAEPPSTFAENREEAVRILLAAINSATS